MIGRVPAFRRLISASASAMGVLSCVVFVIALNPAPAFACSNEQVRSESKINPVTKEAYSLGLPDCRAYEMVSPLAKQGYSAEIMSNRGLIGFPTAPNGEAVGFAAGGLFSEPENSYNGQLILNTYLARRTESGWSTHQAFAPANLVFDPEIDGLGGDFVPEMSSAPGQAVRQVNCGKNYRGTGESGTANTDQGFVCAVRESNGSWAVTPTYWNPHVGGLDDSELYLGASADLSRVFFQPDASLVPADETLGIYEIAGMGTATPRLRLVNVDNNERELSYFETKGGRGLEGPYLGDFREGGAFIEGTDYHAISESGE